MYRTIQTSEEVDPNNNIVFEFQRMMLFKICRSCGQEMDELNTSTCGTLFEISGTYPDRYVLHWQSQPVVRRIPAGNLQLYFWVVRPSPALLTWLMC